MKVFQKLNRFDRLMAAISFAESNEQNTAVHILEDTEQPKAKRRARKAPEKQNDNRPRLQM